MLDGLDEQAEKINRAPSGDQGPRPGPGKRSRKPEPRIKPENFLCWKVQKKETKFMIAASELCLGDPGIKVSFKTRDVSDG
jgi:hypothetical protein